ncbi:retron St85 family RNA-directed DNA polymerase [Enterobacter bugandensis]|uniref:retron St85 family RNA-directed DNA polymerase n=3 Tax=Enterobacter bugandensis TaxID=881260 RepID=UPI0005ECBABE|nr:retron St85 family RNA-directed DNA polymerase [Enterobacter bugandensis]KJN33343.1 DNA polymerase [Enterobacter bugandensis]HCK7256245.1 retron St85 family RNA-directed DNA polymerase [Enterobacter bugandensis]HCK7306970.1 retron St85 family RNA-directed DNA polymerase [Enterobacter bugandensis]HCK7320089.1 retron St85 family RNA-directed DNA polymerase [Enterobacter bugandensis]HEG2127867.1 retron St85 family RNA-directed DNA polymerase [Enterobacter bugandensis]
MRREWEDFYLEKGINTNFISTYLDYIKTLESRNIPVIFEVEHLSKLIGIKYPEINDIVFGTKSFYREFKIPKKKGGYRKISSPYPSLRKCQTWIHEKLLYSLRTHKNAFAYKKGKSIIDNAEQHLNNHFLLKIDIKDFFPSIPINWVIKLFDSLGYAKNVSYALASLCCLDGCLPQGGITSPSLSNILLYPLDERLSKLALKFNLKYSRYADDMVFSGEAIPSKFISYVTDIIESYGFILNKEKTKLLNNTKQKIVTGIDVSKDKLQLPRKTRREIRKTMHYIKKYGIFSHIDNEKIKDPNYIKSLEGKIRFWLQVEPDNQEARSYIEHINQMK